jgi:hypothetical protein
MNVRRSHAALVLGTVPLAFHVACGSNGGGFSGEVGTYEPDAGSFGTSDATAAGTLDAHIEENHVVVSIVTLSCAGSCANVEAVATGGHPPYTFAWEDGSTNPARQVCPTANASYRVNVSDTGASGELARAMQTVQASFKADVLACPDGGTGTCDSLVAGVSPTGANPSGVWSYGWTSTLGASFTIFNAFASGGVDDWQNGINTNPVALFNSTTAPFVSRDALADGATSTLFSAGPDQFVMGPGLSGEYAVARWTARTAGTYRVTGAFQAASSPQAAADVHVQHDSVDVTSGSISEGGAHSFPFALGVHVAAGDTIDFATSAPAGWVLDGPTTGYPYVDVDAHVCASSVDGG